MRIAIIVEECHKAGGYERYVAEIVQRISNLHEVHVFANSFADVENEKVIFHRVPIIKKPFLTFPSFFINSTILVKLSGKFDIIHAQGIHSLIQNVVTNHFTHQAYNKATEKYYPRETNLLKKIHSYLSKKLAYKLEETIYSPKSKIRVLAVSEDVKKETNEYYHKSLSEITVIHNGVELEKFNPLNKANYRKVIRDKYNIKDDDYLLLFAGKDWERKGLELAMKAVTLLDDKVKLIVVGKWHKQKQYEQTAEKLKIKDSVIFTGRVEGLEPYYAAADVFLFPSYYETFSIVLLEAAASGLPILIARTRGIDWFIELIGGLSRELNIDIDELYLIKHSPEDICQKINNFRTNKEKVEEIAGKIRQKLEETDYSWDKTANLVLKVYEEVAGKQ